MLFNSLSFLIFFPIVVLVCFIIPLKYRWIWLLVVSYYFYMSWNVMYSLLLIVATVVTYLSGLLLKHYNGCTIRKVIVAVSFIANLGILAFYKYSNFVIGSLNKIMGLFRIQFSINYFDILLPVGISFYIFQSLSYTMDVYRKEIEPEKNLFRYALFVSFFPQLVAGPIERSKNLLAQVREPVVFKYENLQRGFLYMCYGYYLKLVVADNAAVVVNKVFSDLGEYCGWYVIFASVLFAFQIYGDFGGYSLIAIGAAKILGFDLMANFESPYISESVSEFWRRWHISLSTWFRDYLYIPLGGNKRGKIRKWFNLLWVFLVSGLWHGAAWHFVVWGGYNGLLVVLGEMTANVRSRIFNLLGFKSEMLCSKVLRRIVTFILIDFGWMIFRADGLKHAISALRSLVGFNNYWILFDGSLSQLGLAEKSVRVLIYSIGIIMVIDIFKYRGVNFGDLVRNQHITVRCAIYVLLIMSTLIFGHWGGNYDASAFLYFQF